MAQMELRACLAKQNVIKIFMYCANVGGIPSKLLPEREDIIFEIAYSYWQNIAT
jgi:hypothetical protein